MKVAISVAGKFHAFYLASQLEKRGHLSSIITTYPKFEVKKYGISTANIKSLWWVEGLARASHAARLPRNFGNVLKKKLFISATPAMIPKECDLFVGWSGGAIKAIRAAKARGIQTLLVRGSSHILHQKEVLQREYEKLGLTAALPPQHAIDTELREYEEADYIYNQTQFVKSTFMARGVDEARIVTTPTGVNLKHFFPVPKEDGKFRIIYCGALSVRKGIHYLLQAFKNLNLPDAELWLIGGETSDTAPLLRRFGSPGVICKGVHPERELHKLYSQGSIFCFPSLEEGLAMVQAQGMACALPLICTDASGGGEFLKSGKGGICVPSASVAALEEAIEKLYRDHELCASMGREAREVISEGFTWDHYGDRICGIYQKILSGRNSPLLTCK